MNNPLVLVHLKPGETLLIFIMWGFFLEIAQNICTKSERNIALFLIRTNNIPL